MYQKEYSLCAHGKMKMAEQVTKSVLFVCLGDICRSPIAEAVFRKLVTDQNISDTWVIDSGAVSDWNVGRSPDPRAVSCLRNHGINTAHKARQVTKEDFATFDYILCMDENNLRDLNRKSNQVKNCRVKIHRNNSWLKILIMVMTLTLRLSTSSVCGAAEPSWRRFADLGPVLLWPRLVPQARILSQVSQCHHSLAKAAALSSVDSLFLTLKNNCRWKSVVVFGGRINKNFWFRQFMG